MDGKRTELLSQTEPASVAIVEKLVRDAGFESFGACDARALETREEVRDMCASNLCGAYGRSWSCPPACGPVVAYEQRLHAFERCLVVQTVGQLEDPFDAEGMDAASKEHTRRFLDLTRELARTGIDHMALGAGPCAVCSSCTYPEEPCRFPDDQVVSMEAAGLVVSDVCTAAGIPYNHGANTIAYTSCVLF